MDGYHCAYSSVTVFMDITVAVTNPVRRDPGMYISSLSLQEDRPSTLFPHRGWKLYLL